MVYVEHVKYGVWGHDIGDLIFECLDVDGIVGRVTIGS